MTTITTVYGQKISLEILNSGHYVLTLEDPYGENLAQIGMEAHEYFKLIDGVDEKP